MIRTINLFVGNELPTKRKAPWPPPGSGTGSGSTVQQTKEGKEERDMSNSRQVRIPKLLYKEILQFSHVLNFLCLGRVKGGCVYGSVLFVRILKGRRPWNFCSG